MTISKTRGKRSVTHIITGAITAKGGSFWLRLRIIPLFDQKSLEGFGDTETAFGYSTWGQMTPNNDAKNPQGQGLFLGHERQMELQTQTFYIGTTFENPKNPKQKLKTISFILDPLRRSKNIQKHHQYNLNQEAKGRQDEANPDLFRWKSSAYCFAASSGLDLWWV